MEIVQNLWKYYTDGGLTMHFISVLSVAALATIIYKVIAFWRVKVNLNQFIAKLRGALLQ